MQIINNLVPCNRTTKVDLTSPYGTAIRRYSGYVFKMCPWPYRLRPFMAERTKGEVVIRKGSSLPDLIRTYYGNIPIHSVEGSASFLTRDMKTRLYEPGVEDPFVMRDHTSVDKFHSLALKIQQAIVTMGKTLGCDVVYDHDRSVDTIAYSLDAFRRDALKEGSRRYNVLATLLSNQDVAKKLSIVREVSLGWWASSYAGRTSGNLSSFMPSIRLHAKCIRRLLESNQGRDLRNKTTDGLGDPLDTNVGFPFFSAVMDEQGNPISKLKVIELFAPMPPPSAGWHTTYEHIKQRARSTMFGRFPLALASIRRTQPGYKWSHSFQLTDQGLVTDHDIRGSNTVRVAYMPPYILNLLLAPLQLELKVARKLLPGCFHDGDAKRRRLDIIRKSVKFMLESDYSNYDRHMPQDIWLEFCKLFLEGHSHSSYWMDMLKFIHGGLPILWPDFLSGAGDSNTGNGWAFVPQSLGLISGIKITSEEGTIVNSIICLQAMLNAGTLDEKSAEQYLMQYESKPAGSNFEFFHIQSDDTLWLDNNPERLLKHLKEFEDCAKQAGIPTKIEMGDRFLMRHNIQGSDIPVPLRVLQNSISNEEPVTDALKFAIGLCSRSDGLFGYKTVDAFQTGRRIKVNGAYVVLSVLVIEAIKEMMSSAMRSNALANNLVALLKELGSSMLAGRSIEQALVDEAFLLSEVVPPEGTLHDLDLIRKRVAHLLAQREIDMIMQRNPNAARLESLVWQLYADRFRPSSAQLLEEIFTLAPELRKIVTSLTTKENGFFQFATNKLKINMDFHLGYT